MIWITEEYDSEVQLLTEEIRRQGHEVRPVSYYKMQQDNSLPASHNSIPDDACVLYYGSINTGLWIQRKKPWVPGCWYNVPQYACTKYYAFLGEYLLNKDYLILPRAEVERKIEALRRSHGVLTGLFIRPDSNSKSFSGQVFFEDTWHSDWRKSAYRTDPQDLCIVSSPKNVLAEWRFFASEGKILTGSQYHKNNELEVIEGYPDDALKLAQEIATKYNPDPIWSIDIAESPQGYFLMEIGTFCTAGLYAADLPILVRTASTLAIKEHKDIYEP